LSVIHKKIFEDNWSMCFTGHMSCVSPTRNKSSAVAEMGDRLATVGMGRKWGGAAVAVGDWVPI